MRVETLRVATGEPGELRVVAEITEGKVVNAEVCSTTTPLSWETLVLEKPVEFAVVAAERVCRGCDASAGLAVAEAAEDALGVDVPDDARRARELLNMANVVKSHARTLAVADLGVEEPAYELVRAAREIVRMVGGKPQHPPAVTVGGLAIERIPVERVESVAKDAVETAEEVLDDVESAVDDLREDLEVEPRERPTELSVSDTYRGDVDRGAIEVLAPEEFYRMRTTRRIATNLVARYEGKPALVGPAARRGGAEHPVEHHVARAEEIVSMLDGIADAASGLDGSGEYRTDDVEAGSGEGAAAVEAPEGVLVVRLRLRNGRVDEAEMITPSNFKAAFAGDLLPGLTVEEVETVLRSLGLSGRCLTH